MGYFTKTREKNYKRCESVINKLETENDHNLFKNKDVNKHKGGEAQMIKEDTKTKQMRTKNNKFKSEILIMKSIIFSG